MMRKKSSSRRCRKFIPTNSFALLLLCIISLLWAAPQCCHSLRPRQHASKSTSYRTISSIQREEASFISVSHGTSHHHHHHQHSSSSLLTKAIPRGGGSNKSSLPQTRRRTLIVLLVATALFNDMLQLTMLLPIIHTLVSSPPPLGVTNNKEVALGLFFASKDICQMMSAPFAGVLCSKFSPQVALISSILGLGLATFVFAEADTFWQLLLARGAQGAASAAVLCGGLSLIAETHPQNVRGKAMGYAQSGLAAGMLMGPIIGGLLFDQLGRKNTFRFAAGMVLANAIAMILLMGVAPPESSWDGEEREKKGDVHKKVVEGEEQQLSLVKSSRQLLRNFDILAVTASTFVIHAVVGVIKPLSQVVLDKEFGVTMVKRSFIISIATLAFFIAAPIAGILSDRMQRSHLVALSLVLMSCSSAFFALRHLGLWAFYVSVALLGVAMGVQKSSSQSLLADLVDKHKLGEYSMVYALSDVADSLGLIVGPLVGLALSQIYGPSVGVLSIGILCLLLTPVMLKIA